MRMHLLSGGRLSMRRSVYYPDASREETFELPVICALIKHPQGNVLFDTGCHPSVATDAPARWGALAKVMRPIFDETEALPGQLPKAGLAASDIDLVICSHLHADHCGCNGFFERATLICHADELASAEAANAREMGFMREDWDHRQPRQTIASQHDVFGDGRLTLLPMPGHTRGMITAHVALERDGGFLLASDAAPVAENLRSRHAARNSWDIDQALAALDEIARLEAQGETIIHGHDDAQWRSLRTGGAWYE